VHEPSAELGTWLPALKPIVSASRHRAEATGAR